VTPLDTLISIAGPALSKAAPVAANDDLVRLLKARNGFYAFESALHVYSSDELAHWNEPALWRSEYGDLIPADCVFFAEDLFGNQFGIGASGVVTFDAETSESKPMAENIAGWAKELLADHRVVTGWPLGHLWQEQHGPLPAGKRLIAKLPFIAGGDYEVANLYLADAVTAMRSRAELARQIAHLPDGARIQIRVKDAN
jgi:hypothetical protein